MRIPLSKAGRPAMVFTAATLVALTAACGPGDLNALGAAAPAPVTATAEAPAASASVEPLPAEPSAAAEGTPTPAPVPSDEPLPEPPLDEVAATSVATSVEESGDETYTESDEESEAAAESAEESGTESDEESDEESGAAQEAVEQVTGSRQQARAEAPAVRQPDARTGSGGKGRHAAPAAATGAPVASGPVTTAAAATPTATTTATAASGGSGGAYSDQARTRYTAANGQSGQYLRYAGGVDPSRPVGLVVYADGTGEYGVDNPTSSYALGGSAGLVAVAKARNMVTLAVESPNQSCECWHTGDTAAYADFLAELIEKQFAAYPIDEVWLAGFSSGAQEITRFLVPRHPELMRVGGGWVVFGGGGPPAASGSAVTAARMAGVRGHWFTGTADTSVPLTASWGARAGESWYAARGVRVSSEYPSGVGHGLFGKLGSTVGRMIDGG